MKSIIRWEQLNGKPFSQLNYGNEDEVDSLFYVCTSPDRLQVSFTEFKSKLTEETRKKLEKDFETEITLVSQFQTASKKKNDEPEDSDPIYMKEIIPMLVMDGLDVHYALNEMELCDLPIYIKAYDKKYKDRLEFQRLGIFWLLSPHVSKKIKSPKDLYQFGWEAPIGKDKKPTQQEIEDSKQLFKSFMQTEKTT